LLQSKNNALSDKADFLNQEVVVRNAIRNLSFLMGEEPSSLWNFTEGFEHLPQDYALGDLLDKTMSNNQTLQNQFIQLKLEQTQTQLAKGDFMPSLSLSAGANNQFNSFRDGGDPVNSNSVSPYGNLSLSYNIYSGGNRKRAMEIAKISEEIVNIETEQMKHSITNLLMNELDAYNARKVMLEVSNESIEAAELNLSIAEDKLKAGVINSFNYRDIQIIYLNSALSRLSAIYNLISSNTVLTRLTGGFVEM
jgi:outer membrane protein TolC